MRVPSCLDCGAPVALVTAAVDPKSVEIVLRAQCGHEITKEIGAVLWREHGWRWTVPALDAAALVTAERARHLTDKGFTPEHDRDRADDLAWAAWCYIDRAIHPTDDPEPPKMWPWEDEEWNRQADAIRRLVIAGALILAELDRRLLEQRSAR